MSAKWDDSDSEAENVAVGEPVILPRARRPSIAKSLEAAGVEILEKPVPGSEKGDNDDDDSDSVVSAGSGGADSEDDYVDQDGDVIVFDFIEHFQSGTNSLRKLLGQFNCEYENIVAEFADVEIFLISIDSLIIECTAHAYHDWTLAGQSLVLITQIDRFLSQFTELGGRFKLIAFSTLALDFARDTTLAWARSVVLAHVCSSPRWAKDVEFFASPADPRWMHYLRELTPSFLLISTDNVSHEVCDKDDVNLSLKLESIAVDVLSNAIPVVLLNGLVVNVTSVNAYYIRPKLIERHNWEHFIGAHWADEANQKSQKIDVSGCKDVVDLWVMIIAKCKNDKAASVHFESLAASVILSTLVSLRRGAERTYLPERQDGRRGLDVIRDRRLLLSTAAQFLDNLNYQTVKFSLSEVWDGRLILGIFDALGASENVLPYRLQEEFAKAHIALGLTKSLALDEAERLFEQRLPHPDPLKGLDAFYKVNSPLLNAYVPEMALALKQHAEQIVDTSNKQGYADWFRENLYWKFKQIECEHLKPTEKIEDAWQQKRANKSRQFLSRWYELFANSLEGRGSNLLVDFSRVPKGFAAVEETNGDDKKKGKQQWNQPGKKQGGGGGPKGGKSSKTPVISKKEQILEQSRMEKSKKLEEGERQQAVDLLEKLLSKLELPTMKALCVSEITCRVGQDLFGKFSGSDKLEQRRVEAVRLVGYLKECFVFHWPHLDDKQREKVVDYWIALGFVPPPGVKAPRGTESPSVAKYSLGINMVYYQLHYAGQLIDIQADPQKDDRVTGFNPDAWQRKMLDVVDRSQSAVIIAPTSAGKTFVSYYCIEKVLRQSDDDVVVYVSPSKALTNQVCGSVYARFRNKSLARGQALFGTLTADYGQNVLNCQVLITVPECLESLLLSTENDVQQFASRIKYVIFDEVHSIGSSVEAPIWEHLLLLIRVPFLALSATIGNAEKLHGWLQEAEKAKTSGTRKVELISYEERYSELELAIQKIDNPIRDLEDSRDEASNGQSSEAKEAEPKKNAIVPFMPFGVYKPEKLHMFGIPDDQQLTARQILELYHMMAAVDEKTKTELEPCTFFAKGAAGAVAGVDPKEREKSAKDVVVWLSRSELRRLESALKNRFLEWLEKDPAKLQAVLEKLGGGEVKEQLEHRSMPFKQLAVAEKNIVPLMDEMREKTMLPAIVFSDDRHVCERLAETLCAELERRQTEFEESAEFKTKFALKDEEKLLKQAKKMQEAAEKRKKKKEGRKGGGGGGKGDDDEGGNDDERDDEPLDDSDPLAAQRLKLKEALARFKLHGRRAQQDDDIYEKMVERMQRSKSRESTRLLLRLFERGIGFHHAGLNMVEKGAVEVLFRSGHLAVIFSTSTLALGMNMPCRTVAFGVDTVLLTPLQFRQMSGRAGRRGFDHSGTVVFMSVPTSKIRRLLTASLSTLRGNTPFTASFLLRLLAFVHQPQDPTFDNKKPVSTLQDRAQMALTLLRHSFIHFTRGGDDERLSAQLRYYVAFSVQFLRHLQLIGDDCVPAGFAELARHLDLFQPGNLAFTFLLQKGTFHSICKIYQENRAELKRRLVLILAHLFTRTRLPPQWNPDDKNSYPSETASKVFFDPLPKEVRLKLTEYNEKTLALYRAFMTAATKDASLVDPRLAISGKATSESACLLAEELVPSLHADYLHDDMLLPVINLEPKDHRGRRVYMNAYAVDFWTHGSRGTLERANRLSAHIVWYRLHDFSNVLTAIAGGLQVVARPQDQFADLMREIAIEYDAKFRSAFGMKTKM